MSEATEKQASFFGTYFERDSILRISRWAAPANRMRDWQASVTYGRIATYGGGQRKA